MPSFPQHHGDVQKDHFIHPFVSKKEVGLFGISKGNYNVKQKEYNLFLESKRMHKLFREDIFMDKHEFQTLLSCGESIPLFY